MDARTLLRGDRGLWGRRRFAAIAHRGLWRHAPENSLEAIAGAFEAGADIVEVGVRRARDGAFVVIADETLDRTTDASGRVVDHDLSALRRARLRSGRGGDAAAVTDAVLPALDDMLVAMRHRGVLSLDAGTRDDLPALARFVAALDAGASTILKSEIASVDDAAQMLEAIAGQAVFMPIISTRMTAWLPALINDLRPLGLPGFEIRCGSIAELHDAAIMANAQRAGVWVNTLAHRQIPGLGDVAACEAPDRVWGTLARHGATLIQSDEVAALCDFRAQLRQAA